jgi:hypothetical protein
MTLMPDFIRCSISSTTLPAVRTRTARPDVFRITGEQNAQPCGHPRLLRMNPHVAGRAILSG